MAIEMHSLISEYVRAVRKIYGHHLKQVILYGSYARGDYTKDSDVDLVLLVDLDEMEFEGLDDEDLINVNKRFPKKTVEISEVQ